VDIDGLAPVAEAVRLAQKVLDNVDGSERVDVVRRRIINHLLALGGRLLDALDLSLKREFVEIR